MISRELSHARVSSPPLYHRIKAFSEISSHIKGTKILDVGCGEDAILERIYENREVIGLDNSRAALLKAKRRAPNAEFILADMRSLPIKDECIEVVVMLAILGAITVKDGRALAFKETSRALGKEGILILLVSNDRFLINLLSLEWHFGWGHFSPNLLKRELQRAGFHVIQNILTGGVLCEIVDAIYGYWLYFWRNKAKRTCEPPLPLRRILFRVVDLEFGAPVRRIEALSRFLSIVAQKSVLLPFDNSG